MKTLVSLLFSAALLAGCATSTPEPAPEVGHDATRSITRIELVYNEQDQLSVMDGGGSAIMGWAGVFGPVGTLVALGVEVGTRVTMASRIERRSKEFTAAVKNSGAMPLNRQFAEQLAARLRAGGREVKLTPAARVDGELARMQAPGFEPTPGYSTLLVRVTTTYGAPDMTSSFKPFVAIEQSLQDEQQAVLHQTTHTSDLEEPAYLAYDGLLQDTAKAQEGLRQGLAGIVQPAYAGMFGEDERPRLAGPESTRTAGLEPK
ncbi:hypothetical protein [Variovorax paradoxus]|uniref:hypothetical protein n=1 Tax=Variovorax paradoxus TaxID=34073 RepID=UPI0027810756|nr:hypothetical protein [Variovorax paradoxus]MDQ0591346.1 hypothetical protein [Variovorax paradoxus]